MNCAPDGSFIPKLIPVIFAGASAVFGKGIPYAQPSEESFGQETASQRKPLEARRCQARAIVLLLQIPGVMEPPAHLSRWIMRGWWIGCVALVNQRVPAGADCCRGEQG